MTLIERGIRKIFERPGHRRLIKFYPSYLRKSNQNVQKAIDMFQPDVLFSKSSIPLVNVPLGVPLVYICDSTVKWTSENWPLFSPLGLKIMEKWEAKVIRKAAHIITFSQANGNILHEYYKIPKDRITVHPIPSSLPHDEKDFQPNPLVAGKTLKLLLVGKSYHGKGVDIAAEVAQKMTALGIPTELRVVGQDSEDSKHISFAGLLSKNDPVQQKEYMDHYRWAHFLIFPSRFDAAGIVPSEAAGFGVPTLTNAAGGLATTVKDKVSGIVLPKHSPASEYVRILQYYLDHPEEYAALRQSTYARYLAELNWNELGDQIYSIIKDVTS
jgi:glycosyltransferase involved in cell wall biosynthesis